MLLQKDTLDYIDAYYTITSFDPFPIRSFFIPQSQSRLRLRLDPRSSPGHDTCHGLVHLPVHILEYRVAHVSLMNNTATFTLV